MTFQVLVPSTASEDGINHSGEDGISDKVYLSGAGLIRQDIARPNGVVGGDIRCATSLNEGVTG